MKVELFYQKTFSLLPFSTGWKRHTVNRRLLNALSFEVRPKTKTFRLSTTLLPNFWTNHALRLQLKLKRWLHLDQIMATEMMTDHVQDVYSARKKSMRRIIVGGNTLKNAPQDLNIRILLTKRLSIKTLQMMRAFQKAKKKMESILALQFLFDR